MSHSITPFTAGDVRRLSTEAASTSIFRNLVSGAFVIPLALALGAQPHHIGLIGASAFIGRVLQIVLIGWSRNVGARGAALYAGASDRLIIMFVASLPFWLAGSAAAPWAIAIGLTLSAMCGELYNISTSVWIAERTRPTERGSFLARRSSWASGFGLPANLAAGALVVLLSSSAAQQSRILGAVLATGAAIGLLGLFIARRVPALEAPVSVDEVRGLLETARHALANPRFRAFVRYSLAWGGSVQLAGPFFTAFVVKVLGFSVLETCMMLALQMGAAALFAPFWGRVADRYGNRVILLGAGFWAALVPFVYVFFGNPESARVLIALELLVGTVWSGINLATSSALLAVVPAADRKRYVAIFSGITGLGLALAPLLGSLVISAVAMIPNTGVDTPYKVLFAISGTLRLLSIYSLRNLPELRARTLQHSAQVLVRAARWWTPGGIASGLLLVPSLAESTRRAALREARLLAKKALPGSMNRVKNDTGSTRDAA
jgi:MFS family permease